MFTTSVAPGWPTGPAPRVIVFRPVEHHDRPFERFGIGGVRLVAAAELGSDDANLYDRRVKQVAHHTMNPASFASG